MAEYTNWRGSSTAGWTNKKTGEYISLRHDIHKWSIGIWHERSSDPGDARAIRVAHVPYDNKTEAIEKAKEHMREYDDKTMFPIGENGT